MYVMKPVGYTGSRLRGLRAFLCWAGKGCALECAKQQAGWTSLLSQQPVGVMQTTFS